MRIVGLTGGIGSGQSTVARLLAERGARIIDADQLAREVVAPGTDALAEIRVRFGDAVIAPDGSLDRRALAAIVFTDDDARADLETITHPRITETARRRMEEAREAGVEVVVYEAALLVEKGLHHGMDALIVVAARPENQAARLVDREGWTETEAWDRIRTQLPLERKLEAADYVVYNDGTLEETTRQVDEIWRRLRHGTAQDDDAA